eukprot:1191268-Prorocentrum_minimum.AAC.1
MPMTCCSRFARRRRRGPPGPGWSTGREARTTGQLGGPTACTRLVCPRRLTRSYARTMRALAVVGAGTRRETRGPEIGEKNVFGLIGAGGGGSVGGGGGSGGGGVVGPYGRAAAIKPPRLLRQGVYPLPATT